jgi:hypothetical protein
VHVDRQLVELAAVHEAGGELCKLALADDAGYSRELGRELDRGERVDVGAAAQLRGRERERLVDAHDVGGERLGERDQAAAGGSGDGGVGAAEVGGREPRAVRGEGGGAVADDAEAARRADREVARGDRAGGGRRAGRQRGARERGSDVRALQIQDRIAQNSACRGARGNGITSRMFSTPVA